MSTINAYAGTRATDRGTLIQNAGEDMSKNAFLNILAAELSNLDPSGNNDSTQYVTQMAQFAQMEQLSNLNNTMTGFANNSLVGKGVTLNVLDDKGSNYTGIVRSVTSTAYGTQVSVEVNEGGVNKYKDFNVEDIGSILDVDDYTYSSMLALNSNMSFLTASSFIDKFVQIQEVDSEGKKIYLTGQVLGVAKDGVNIKVRVKLDETNEIKEYLYTQITKAANSKEELSNLDDPNKK